MWTAMCGCLRAGFWAGVFVLLVAVHVKASRSMDSKESPESREHHEGTEGKFSSTRLGEKEIIAKDPYGKYIETKLDVGFVHAFVASLSVIVVSELGDKTFFIAAIMAMRQSRVTVFMGAISALGIMTILSALLGAATTVIPRWITYYTSSALFAVFGVKMLREGYTMSPDEGLEEYEEVQEDLKKRETEAASAMNNSGDDTNSWKMEKQDIETGIIQSRSRGFSSRIFIQALTLTFLAEWGDRSQIATIILAAREEVVGVILGGILGHGLCTGLAVIGGRYIAQKISVRTVTLVGGVVFIIFALSAFFVDLES